MAEGSSAETELSVVEAAPAWRARWRRSSQRKPPIVETIMVGLFAVLMLHPDTKERFAYLRAGRERERAGGSTAA